MTGNAGGALKPSFSRNARRQLVRLARKNPELLDRVIEVLTHVVHEPFRGLHKPEPLVGDLAGFWSVRLTHKDRLIYRVEGRRLLVASIEGHYANG
jgi:toxin YoeB